MPCDNILQKTLFEWYLQWIILYSHNTTIQLKLSDMALISTITAVPFVNTTMDHRENCTLNYTTQPIYNARTDPAFIPSTTEKILESFALIIFSVIAIIGNVSLWLIICRERALRNVSNALILCLSTADVLISGVSIPVIVYTIIYGTWNFSQSACVGLGFLTMTAFIASVASLGVISINRYIFICYPQHKTIYSENNTAIVIIGKCITSSF